MRLIDSFRVGQPRRARPTGAETETFGGIYQTWTEGTEKLQHDFQNYVTAGYYGSGVVFACILARGLLFSEAEFKFRRLDTRDLFGSPALMPLEEPWPNGTTGELLFRMEQDTSLGGNFFAHKQGERIHRLRPDWTEIVTNPETRQAIGYIYREGGPQAKPRFIPADEVAHWSPIPDPLGYCRGMSWLMPVVREINSDTKMTQHKEKFFDHAATPNMVIKVEGKLPPELKEAIKDELSVRHEGVENAYRTLLLEGGADATVVGQSFEQMSFSATQAAGENRIAVAAGTPGIVVGLKEGLSAATYSNYAQAMRRFADLTMRPLWRSAAAALAPLVNVPSGSRLWYDDRDIPALKQDEKDRAEIMRHRAVTAQTLIAAGYDPAAVGKVVETGEGLDTLMHTGLIPTTLAPAGQEEATPLTSKDNN